MQSDWNPEKLSNYVCHARRGASHRRAMHRARLGRSGNDSTITESQGAILDRLDKSARDTAKSVGSCLVESIPNLPVGEDTFTVTIDPEDVSRIIDIAKPRVVYTIKESFDANVCVGDVISERTDESDENIGDLPVPDAIEQLRKRVASYGGETCSWYIGFVVDGIFHILVARTLWFDAFDEELERLSQEWRDELKKSEASIASRKASELTNRATELAKHPAFNAGRVSFEKRLYLAERLFPELDHQAIHRITDRAEKIDWLIKTGFFDND